MLANITSCLFSWLLLAALSLHLCRMTVGTPLKTPQNTKKLDTLDRKECVEFSRILLNVSYNLTLADELFEGFNCTEERMVVNTAVSACEPNAGEGGGCSGAQNTRFNQNVCLGNIKVDLEYHRNKLLAYKNYLLDSSVVEAINNLLKNCNFPSAPQGSRDSTLTTPISPQSLEKFDTRQQLCRELKGFHVRTITINRIMGYIAAQKEEEEN